MKSLILASLLITSTYLHCQEKIIKGKVTGANNTPVAYASVGITGTPYGTVADENGDFIFYVPKNAKALDTLKISCLGFYSKSFAVATLPDFLSVNLIEYSMNLPEIIVRSKNLETKVVGNQKESTFMKCNFAIGDKPNQNLGSEIVRKFFFKGSKHYLNKINVHTAYNFDTVLFRLNIYAMKNGLPDSNLLGENIILELCGPKIGWSTLDLKKYNLVYDQNIVVALQWIGHSKRGNIAQLLISMPAFGAVHFYKFGSQDRWWRYNNMSTSISLEVEREN